MATTKSKKQIQIFVSEKGNKYFYIWEVTAYKSKETYYIYDRYLTEDKAKQAVDFIKKHLANLYDGAYMTREIVHI